MKKHYIEYSCRITLASNGESSNVRLFSTRDYDQEEFLKIVKNTFENYRDRVVDQYDGKSFIDTLELCKIIVEEHSDFVKNRESDYRDCGHLEVN